MTIRRAARREILYSTLSHAVMANNNMFVRIVQALEGLVHTFAWEHPAKGL